MSEANQIRGRTTLRQSTQCRETRETQIALYLNLDGGERKIETGIGFFSVAGYAPDTNGEPSFSCWQCWTAARGAAAPFSGYRVWPQYRKPSRRC